MFHLLKHANNEEKILGHITAADEKGKKCAMKLETILENARITSILAKNDADTKRTEATKKATAARRSIVANKAELENQAAKAAEEAAAKEKEAEKAIEKLKSIIVENEAKAKAESEEAKQHDQLNRPKHTMVKKLTKYQSVITDEEHRVVNPDFKATLVHLEPFEAILFRLRLDFDSSR